MQNSLGNFQLFFNDFFNFKNARNSNSTRNTIENIQKDESKSIQENSRNRPQSDVYMMPTSAQKRPADTALVAVPQLAKRTRNDEIQNYKDKQLAEQGIQRTSNLFAPIMKLEGHESDIFTCEFHPDGEYLGKFKVFCEKNFNQNNDNFFLNSSEFRL